MLIVGAGPTGLEAALQLGKRGYQVTLAEATRTLGGRVARERGLPGLSAWGRVADYRTGQLAPMANVQIYPRQPPDRRGCAGDGGATMSPLPPGPSGGAMRWRGCILHPIPTDPAMPIFTPDDLMAGAGPTGGRVVLYDDDHFYMGSVLAELLVSARLRGRFRHPGRQGGGMDRKHAGTGASSRRLLEIGRDAALSKAPEAVGADGVVLGCTWTGRETALACDAVVMVTSRVPNDALYHGVMARRDGVGGACGRSS